MKKTKAESLVRTALALSIHKPQSKIGVQTSLKQLGGDDVTALELTTRLYRAISGKKKIGFAQFRERVQITPKSSVAAIATKLLPLVLLHGDDPTELKAHGDDSTVLKATETNDAVRIVLAERTNDFAFFQIEPHFRLGEDLNLGPAQIAEVKIDLFKALGSGDEFGRFASALQDVNEGSSVGQLMESLPGDDTTELK